MSKDKIVMESSHRCTIDIERIANTILNDCEYKDIEYKFINECPNCKNEIHYSIFIESRKEDIKNIKLSIKQAEDKIKSLKKCGNCLSNFELEGEFEVKPNITNLAKVLGYSSNKYYQMKKQQPEQFKMLMVGFESYCKELNKEK